MTKISIIGAGSVGSLLAYNLATKNFADIVLIDIVEGLPQGKALDILEAMPIVNSDSRIIGSNDFKDSENSKIIIMIAGFPRKPGMTRDDLITANSKIMNSVIPELVKYSPNAILIVVTNPLSAMTYLAYKLSGFSKNKVLGMAGILDSSRFNAFIAKELDISVKDIKTVVFGDHGDLMVPVISHCSIKDRPLADFLSQEDLKKITERTKNAGAEIISFLKTSSTSFAPVTAISEMVDCILNDKKIVLPCTVLLEGEYDTEGVFVGVPVVLGKDGVEEIVEFDLTTEEKKAFEDSVEHIKKTIEKL